MTLYKIPYFKPRYWYHRIVDYPYLLAIFMPLLRYFPMGLIYRDIADICELRGHESFEYGHWQYAFTLWRHAQKLRHLIACQQQYTLDNDGDIILKYQPWGIAIGHLCLLGHLIRLKQQEFIDKNIIIYDDGHPIANPFLFDYLSSFITVKPYEEYIKNKDKIDVLSSRMVWLCDQYYWDYFAKTSAQNHALLSLSQSQKNAFYDEMQSLGLKHDGWFVTLHLRGNGYDGYQKYPTHQQYSHRNSDIANYYHACKLICEAGGQVVLLGDDDKIINDDFKDYIIDYAHSNVKSARNDVMLCAENLFFMGNNSGINQVPQLFGKNILITNQIPYIHQTTRYGDVWLPKKLYHQQKQRFLTFDEVFHAPYCAIENANSFAKYGIMPIDNNADELLSAVHDMLKNLGILDNNNEYHDYRDIQNHIKHSDPTITHKIYSNIAPSFIRANKDLFK